MKNFWEKLQLHEGFEELFHEIEFLVGGQNLTDGVPYYFSPETTSINYTLKATNGDEEKQTDSGTTSVTAGKLYTITYSFETKALVLVP